MWVSSEMYRDQLRNVLRAWDKCMTAWEQLMENKANSNKKSKAKTKANKEVRSKKGALGIHLWSFSSNCSLWIVSHLAHACVRYGECIACSATCDIGVVLRGRAARFCLTKRPPLPLDSCELGLLDAAVCELRLSW